jgi:hypothetical protein
LFSSVYRGTSTKLPDNWFLKFDEKTQTLQGMPEEADAGSHDLTLLAYLDRGQPFFTASSFKVRADRLTD